MTTQKLYVYADESGQDTASLFFITVAVASDRVQEDLRHRLIHIENLAGTGSLKWHKTQSVRRLKYLDQVLAEKIGHGEVFFGVYPKPIPYFFPLLDVVEHAIRCKAQALYTARVHVDGIDRKKAAELTTALRVRGIRLEAVRSRRDESEPIIRLADRWAGCIRAAQSGRAAESKLLEHAQNSGYLSKVSN